MTVKKKLRCDRFQIFENLFLFLNGNCERLVVTLNGNTGKRLGEVRMAGGGASESKSVVS